MLIIGHTALGIVTGLLIDNPVAAFGVGLVSHHVADATPHFDPGSFYTHEPWRPMTIQDYVRRDLVFVGLDLFLTLVLLVVLYPRLPSDRIPSLFAGVVGANLPDFVHNVPFWGPYLRRFGWIAWWQDAIHRRFQSTVPARIWYLGLMPQVLVIGFTIWLIERGVG